MLSIVLPAFNEEDAVADVAADAVAAGPAIAAVPGVGSVEVVVVDDGSSDRTAERAASVEGVRVVSLGRNRGYGAALKAGFAAAEGDLLAFCDADGTCSPAVFEELSRVLGEENADVVIGSRLGGGTQMPPVRQLGNRIFATLLGVLSLKQVSDTASGMRVLTRDALDRLLPLPDGLNFTPAMTAKILLSGRMKIAESPIPYGEREGHSKLSVVKDGLRFFRTIFETALLFQPFRILGLVGGLLWVVAAAFEVEPTLQYISQGWLEERFIFRLISIVVFALLGQQLLSAGALAEDLKGRFVGIPASRNPLCRLVGWLHTPPVAVAVVVLLSLAALALNFTGLVRYLSEGNVGDMPWHRVLAGGYLLVTAAQVFVGALLAYMIRLVHQEARPASDGAGTEAANTPPRELAANGK